MTKGEYRVGITFNPSGNELVNHIKRMSADLIDLLEVFTTTVMAEGDDSISFNDKKRLAEHAQQLIEDAAMNGVKAATKGAFKE